MENLLACAYAKEMIKNNIKFPMLAEAWKKVTKVEFFQSNFFLLYIEEIDCKKKVRADKKLFCGDDKLSLQVVFFCPQFGELEKRKLRVEMRIFDWIKEDCRKFAFQLNGKSLKISEYSEFYSQKMSTNWFLSKLQS